MKIGNLQKVSLIDYPGKISSVIFTQGCNFRCPYCHNPELVNPALYQKCLAEEVVMSHLTKRKGRLEAVVITGGEPALQKDIGHFINNIKYLNYLIKIDTNGSRPEVLSELLRAGLLDYIAMDVKAPYDKYRRITRAPVSARAIQQSIELIMNSGIDYEFRTTVATSQLSKEDILHIGRMINNASRYVIQPYRKTKSLEPHLPDNGTLSADDIAVLKDKLQENVKKLILRF